MFESNNCYYLSDKLVTDKSKKCTITPVMLFDVSFKNILISLVRVVESGRGT